MKKREFFKKAAAGTGLAAFLGALFVCAGAGRAHATEIGGTISSTLTITEDSELVDDVTCTVVGADRKSTRLKSSHRL